MSDEWWESGPVFSTTDHGQQITVVPPGDQTIPRLQFHHVMAIAGVALVTAVAMTLALPASLPPLAFGLDFDAGALWWWIPVTIAAVLGMINLVAWLSRTIESQFRQKSVSFRATTAAVAGGLAVAFQVWSHLLLRSDAESAFGGAPQSITRWAAPGFAVVCLIAVIALPLAARRAARRAETIVALRDHGMRWHGTIIDIPDPKLWVLGRPQFHVTVRYDDAAGEHTLHASMSTHPERVPLPGSPVLVFVGDDGSTYIEVDTDRPLTFATNTSRYRASADGGS